MKKIKLSCTLATFNEGENVGRCLAAVKDLVDEMVVVDGGSSDDTVKIAKQYGARVVVTDNPEIFHINKQKANDKAKGEWILQLDADEVVSQDLAAEILKMINISDKERDTVIVAEDSIYARHQRLIEARDGKVGSSAPNDPVVAFFVPRRNYFLGRFLKYGGTYPDGVIRLFRKGKARLPCISVHEQYEVDGRVGWLSGDLLHYDSPTFSRYLERNDRYAVLFADELRKDQVRLNWVNWLWYGCGKPVVTFLSLYVRHKGFLDGFPGLVWAIFSGLTWAKAWLRYSHASRNNAKSNPV
jgi:glycosyltransferase involved in cell wall biosynthesis